MSTPPLFSELAPAAPPSTIQGPWPWARFSDNGYECSTVGDKRFSALVATLKDGRTIEQAYQLGVKGHGKFGSDWRLGKGKPPLDPTVDLWAEYLLLWRTWAAENPELIQDLAQKARGKVLTDRFASSPMSQARALAQILSEMDHA